MSRPRLLLVNDDGIGAIGLHKLKAAAATVSDDVWIVAPAAECSGVSHAISLTRPRGHDRRRVAQRPGRRIVRKAQRVAPSGKETR
jgi:5'/3'-nucleotidase SurE